MAIDSKMFQGILQVGMNGSRDVHFMLVAVHCSVESKNRALAQSVLEFARADPFDGSCRLGVSRNIFPSIADCPGDIEEDESPSTRYLKGYEIGLVTIWHKAASNELENPVGNQVPDEDLYGLTSYLRYRALDKTPGSRMKVAFSRRARPMRLGRSCRT